jgi:deazaflavin-dependent oxidoreductase (nitroreductase family)
MGTQFAKLSAGERFFNSLMSKLFRLGWAPHYGHELEVVGRKSRALHRTAVNLLELDGTLYLVAPRGETQWVKNARAAGEVALRRKATRTRYRVRELETDKRAAVLQAYLARYASQVARFFSVSTDAPVSAFEAIASRYPVFQLEALATPDRVGG